MYIYIFICIYLPARIQECPKKGISPNQSYSGDGIQNINPTLGRGLDSLGMFF